MQEDELTRSASTDTFSVVAFAKQSVNTSDGELEASSDGTRDGFNFLAVARILLGFSGSSFSSLLRHDIIEFESRVELP